MSIVTYPLNGITYDAEDAQTYLCTRNSGLFDTDDDFALTVSDDMEVTISSGQAWIKYADYRGISVCSDSSVVLTVPTASSLDRIDRVVLRFDKTNNLSSLVIVEGTAASSPSAPDIEQDELIYELGLYTIAVAASATSIDSSCITDTRADTAVCGKMKDPVTTDSSSADNAATADALSTARSIQVNLASEDAASFDGTADVTPGVTGTLPYSHGGTGATTLAKALYNLINGRTSLDSDGLSDSDYIPVQDTSASTGKRVTLSTLADYLGVGDEANIVVGTYTGAASASSTTAQAISLGSQPSFVWAIDLEKTIGGKSSSPYWYVSHDSDNAEYTVGMYSAVAIPDYPVHSYTGSASVNALEVTSTGFSVANVKGDYTYSNEDYSFDVRLNITGDLYAYIAIF